MYIYTWWRESRYDSRKCSNLLTDFGVFVLFFWGLCVCPFNFQRGRDYLKIKRVFALKTSRLNYPRACGDVRSHPAVGSPPASLRLSTASGSSGSVTLGGSWQTGKYGVLTVSLKSQFFQAVSLPVSAHVAHLRAQAGDDELATEHRPRQPESSDGPDLFAAALT